MRAELNLVRGAVAKKDLVPVLTHFHFYGGRVQGGNGALCIDTPIECSYVELLTVPARSFLSAVDACGGEPQLKLDDSGRLVVSKGRFRAKLPLLPSDSYPRVQPTQGERHPPIGDIEALLPFVSRDASRPWSRGVLLREGYAYATNNIAIARCKADFLGTINIPGEALTELSRIGTRIDGFVQSDNEITFWFGDAWLYSRLYDLAWPDLSAVLSDDCLGVEMPTGIVQAVESVLPFAHDASFPIVSIDAQGVSCAEARVDVDIPGLVGTHSFAAEPLLEVLRVARRIDFTSQPIQWVGDQLSGAIVPRMER